MTQIPPLNGLRAFDVAGRHQNFRAAADEIGVTQGAVAQHVRQLEAHLGIPAAQRIGIHVIGPKLPRACRRGVRGITRCHRNLAPRA